MSGKTIQITPAPPGHEVIVDQLRSSGGSDYTRYPVIGWAVTEDGEIEAAFIREGRVLTQSAAELDGDTLAHVVEVGGSYE